MNFLNYELPINVISQILSNPCLYQEDLNIFQLVNKSTFELFSRPEIKQLYKDKEWKSSKDTLFKYDTMLEIAEIPIDIISFEDFLNKLKNKEYSFYSMNWFVLWIIERLPNSCRRDNFIDFGYYVLNSWVYTAPELLFLRWNELIDYIVYEIIPKFDYKFPNLVSNEISELKE